MKILEINRSKKTFNLMLKNLYMEQNTKINKIDKNE